MLSDHSNVRAWLWWRLLRHAPRWTPRAILRYFAGKLWEAV